MTKQPDKVLPVNLKEQNAAHSFRITFRDRNHFYTVVKWLNDNVGKGADKWTMEGRVLKRLKAGTTVSPLVYIFRQDFDPAAILYLNLI